MKKYLSVIISLLLIMCVCSVSFAQSNPTGINISSMKTTDLNGNSISGTIFGKYNLTYLNYWATWCSPCVGELAHIQKMSQDSNFKSMGLNVMGMLLEDSRSNVSGAKSLLSQKGCTYTNIRVNSDSALKKLISNSGNGIPVSYLLDSTGTVISYKVGSMDETTMRSFINNGFKQVSSTPTPKPTATPTPKPTATPTPKPTATPTPKPTATPTPKPTATPTPKPTATPKIILGDVNNDGHVNTGDAVLILKFSAGSINSSNLLLSSGDVNKDKAVNTGDAVLILKYSANLIDKF